MSRFVRASHVIWHCQYHVGWVPKYRYRVLQGPVGKEVYKCVMVFCQQLDCEVVELNVQTDHIHLLVKVPPKLSSSELMGVLKGRSAIRLYNRFPHIRKKLWGNHFWARGYFVDTVGVNEEIIRRYVRHQDKKDQEIEQQMELLQD